MRIGLVMTDTPRYSETFLNNKIKGLQESGFHVIVFTDASSGKAGSFECVAAFPVYKNPFLQSVLVSVVLLLTAIRAPRPAARFWRLQRHEGKSISAILKSIYANAHILPRRLDWLHFTFATFAIGRESLAKAIMARMGMSIRGFDIAIYPLKKPGCFDLAWRYLDKLHTISDDLLVKAYAAGMPQTMPFQKITPAIDTKGFEAKGNPGYLAETVRISTVGRLHWKKGYEHTLIALAELKQAGFSFTYRIAGEGEERERLIYAVHALGLQENVHFEGKLAHDKVKQLYLETDIYLQPSLQEGFCNAVLEAQLAGALCIVSDAEGLPENVQHGKTGWVVPRRNAKALAAAIRHVITETTIEERKTIALAAMDRVKRDYNIERQKEGFIAFFSA